MKGWNNEGKREYEEISKVIKEDKKMDDDTIYFVRNDFERELKRTQGVKAFREYRRKLYEDQQKEEELFVGYANGEFLKRRKKE